MIHKKTTYNMYKKRIKINPICNFEFQKKYASIEQIAKLRKLLFMLQVKKMRSYEFIVSQARIF